MKLVQMTFLLIWLFSKIDFSTADCSSIQRCTDCNSDACGGQCFNLYGGLLNFFQNGDCYWKKVHGNWGWWSSWTYCSRTCGSQTRSRLRNCNNPSPQYQGNNCYGSNYETKSCYLSPCPVDGNWAPWSGWTECSATCGYATQNRTRSCTNPPPSDGGKDCFGSASDIRVCDSNPFCPGCDVAVPNRIRLNTESMQNEECLRMGYCFEKENIPNPKCYMKKGPAGKRYESSMKMTSIFGKELGKSISQIQCSLKCTLDENCGDVVFKPTNSNKGNCYVATGDHVPTADHTKTGYIMKSAKP